MLTSQVCAVGRYLALSCSDSEQQAVRGVETAYMRHALR